MILISKDTSQALDLCTWTVAHVLEILFRKTSEQHPVIYQSIKEIQLPGKIKDQNHFAGGSFIIWKRAWNVKIENDAINISYLHLVTSKNAYQQICSLDKVTSVLYDLMCFK